MTSYFDQVQNLSGAAACYTDLLRKQIGAASPAAHGSTGARLPRAAHHESAGVAASSTRKPAIALMVSSALCARPSNHAGVLTNARGPPLLPTAYCQLPTALAHRDLRSHPHADPKKSRHRAQTETPEGKPSGDAAGLVWAGSAEADPAAAGGGGDPA